MRHLRTSSPNTTRTDNFSATPVFENTEPRWSYGQAVIFCVAMNFLAWGGAAVLVTTLL